MQLTRSISKRSSTNPLPAGFFLRSIVITWLGQTFSQARHDTQRSLPSSFLISASDCTETGGRSGCVNGYISVKTGSNCSS